MLQLVIMEGGQFKHILHTEKQFNGLPVFFASAPVTVTFNGSDLYYEEVSLMVDGSCDAAGYITTGEGKADIQFDVCDTLSDAPDEEFSMFLGYPTGNYATIVFWSLLCCCLP